MAADPAALRPDYDRLGGGAPSSAEDGEPDPLLQQQRRRRPLAAAAFYDLPALLSLLPRPLGPRRSNSRLVFPVASFVLCLFALIVILSSPLAHPRRASLQLSEDYRLASDQSFGFFDDVPSSTWIRMRDRSRSTPAHNDAGLGLRSEFLNRDDPARWYQNNWDPDFTCPGERRVPGDAPGEGGKWVCDPLRIKARADKREAEGGGGCLAYSVGLGGGRGGDVVDLRFERALLDELGGPGSCEVHVFDRRLADAAAGGADVVPAGVVPHPWSVEAESEKRSKGRRTHLTFAETVRKLGHGGRTIDVLKADCGGCEWAQYGDWFGGGASASSSVAGIGQILAKLHGAPHKDNDFFERLRRMGYVVFHKEVDAQRGGTWVEYGFLRLRRDFFED